MVQWRAPKDDGGTPITNYVVEKKDVKKPWEPWSVVSSSGTSTKAKVSRLEKGREYIVRVRAENKIGIGAGLESPPTIAKHMFNPPGPPGFPECSDITENAVTIEWALPDYDGGSPISGYVIERREMTGKWIRVNKTPVLDLRYRVSGLFEGNSYEFRVFAENIAGISEPSLTSDPIKATRAITKPGPPGNLKLKDWSKSYADICWTKPTRDGGSPILGYVVEAQKSGTAQWDRINKDLIKICAYRVPGLIEGLEYRIRIRATNKVGDSEPRELPETILAKDILVPPEIVVDVSCRDSVTVRAGQIISLITRVKGRPDPEITWTKDARALSRDKRTEINNNYPLCELIINDVVRSDYGKYAISAKNSSGQAQATILVNVLDTPGACQNLKVAYVTKKSSHPLSRQIPLSVETSKPAPTSCWSKGGKYFKPSDLVQIETTATSSTLSVKYAGRKDSGEYTITASNPFGVKEETVKVKVLDVPSAPGPIECSGVSSEKVTLTWTAPTEDGGDNIKVEIPVMGRPRPTVSWQKDGAPLKLTQRTNVELSPATTIITINECNRTDSGVYSMTAKNIVGSVTDNITVKVHDIPGAPKGPVKIVEISRTYCIFSWETPENDGGVPINNYAVEIRDTTLVWTNVVSGNEYIFRVMAVNKYGLENPEVTAISKDSMVVMWQAPKYDGGTPIINYVIERKDKSALRWIKCNIRKVKDLQFKATGLVPGHEYEFRISAENAAGVSVPSVPTLFYKATDALYKPGAPCNPRVIDTTRSSITVAWNKPVYNGVTNKAVTLTWDPPVNDGGVKVKNYIVEKRESTRKAYATVNANCHSTTFTVDHLLEGCNYYFRVLAENEYGIGLPIETVEAVKVSEKPQPPGKIILKDVTKNSVTLSWEKPEHDGGSRVGCYVVEIQPK
uniref:Titin n=1 Tax=Nothobranchius furzeri TaxID=105023 RepID=A0A8C6L5R0_NOTFU